MGFDGCMHSRQARSNQSVGKDACAVVVHKEALFCFIFKVVIKPSVRACTPAVDALFVSLCLNRFV